MSKVDETSSKLLIKEAKLTDAGKYTCLCAYDSGHRDDVKTTVYVYGTYARAASAMCTERLVVPSIF